MATFNINKKKSIQMNIICPQIKYFLKKSSHQNMVYTYRKLYKFGLEIKNVMYISFFI
jgi:hypothetical protein